MERKDFYELAEQNGVKVIEVTSGINGYPEGLRCAIIGFDSFEDAEKMAREHELDVVILHRRDGWQFWESKGRTFEPINVTAEMYGDDYELLESMTPEQFYDNMVLPRISEIGDIYSLSDAVDSLKEIWDNMDGLGEGEAVLLRDGDFDKVVDVETCEWSYDTHNYTIAVM